MEHYTIELPQGIFNFFKRRNMKRRLTKKLAEYWTRCYKLCRKLLNAKKIGDAFYKACIDAFYKACILKELLNKNRVDTAALAQKMQKEAPAIFDWTLFEQACDVIRAYVYDTPGILTGGTGLPK